MTCSDGQMGTGPCGIAGSVPTGTYMSVHWWDLSHSVQIQQAIISLLCCFSAHCLNWPEAHTAWCVFLCKKVDVANQNAMEMMPILPAGGLMPAASSATVGLHSRPWWHRTSPDWLVLASHEPFSSWTRHRSSLFVIFFKATFSMKTNSIIFLHYTTTRKESIFSLAKKNWEMPLCLTTKSRKRIQ